MHAEAGVSSPGIPADELSLASDEENTMSHAFPEVIACFFELDADGDLDAIVALCGRLRHYSSWPAVCAHGRDL
jgi:hypothetical protein